MFEKKADVRLPLVSGCHGCRSWFQILSEKAIFHNIPKVAGDENFPATFLFELGLKGFKKMFKDFDTYTFGLQRLS